VARRLRLRESHLQEFFEGVETLLKTRRDDEVAFNLTFNKASLKKVIQDYSTKEVRPASRSEARGGNSFADEAAAFPVRSYGPTAAQAAGERLRQGVQRL